MLAKITNITRTKPFLYVCEQKPVKLLPLMTSEGPASPNFNHKMNCMQLRESNELAHITTSLYTLLVLLHTCTSLLTLCLAACWT